MLQTQSSRSIFPRIFRLTGLLLVCALASIALLSLNAGRAYAATNAAVTYADNHWNWTYYDPNNHSTVGGGSMQPNFQCAEFVARALTRENLMPGLDPYSSSQSAYGSYRGYDLLSITSTSGLYNYLVDHGMGTNIGHDLSQASPGDVVVFSDSSGTREHTVMITSVGSSTSTTLIDAHNAAWYHKALSYEVSGFASYFILHITVQANACPALLSQGDSSTWVSVLQTVLNSYERNYAFSKTSPDSWSYPLSVDGSFGAQTEAAVVDFQYSSLAGLGSSGGGQVGDRTWSALGFCESYTPPGGITPDYTGIKSESICPATLSYGDSNVWVRALQMRLNQAYFYGEFANSPNGFQPYLMADGQFGTMTQNAVIDYQTGTGIGSNGGTAGPETWSDLGMCR